MVLGVKLRMRWDHAHLVLMLLSLVQGYGHKDVWNLQRLRIEAHQRLLYDPLRFRMHRLINAKQWRFEWPGLLEIRHFCLLDQFWGLALKFSLL